MKKIVPGKITLFVALVCLVLTTAFKVASRQAENYTDDFWQQLGISEEEGSQKIKDGFLNGYLTVYGLKEAKNILLSNRAAVTRDLLNYAKHYVQSKEFQDSYARYRNSYKPSGPYRVDTFLSENERRNRHIRDVTATIEDYNKRLKSIDPQYKPGVEKSVAEAMEDLADLQSSQSEIMKDEQSQIADYKTKLSEWEKEFPSNPALFIKIRLQQMLNLTKDIDYSAELVTRNATRYFVNPVYEKKDQHWKYAFRAGKEVTETARAFAMTWLKEIN